MASGNDTEMRASRSYRAGGRSAVVAGAPTSQTGDPANGRTGDADRAQNGLVAQMAAMPSPIRLQMQLLARQSSRPDDALVPIIDLLVADGSERKRAAIVTAFRSHDALREQWERTWELLRSN
jgi:hypothetical protein